MYLTTRAIVFRQTRYSDTSLVVKLLTEESGLMSCLIKGAHNPKAKVRASLFQPLSLLELLVSVKEKSELQFIREARVEHAWATIPGDIRKMSVLLFLNELLYKAIREEAAHPELFRYIHDQLVFLDQAQDITGTYHLLFALHLTRLLGFFPHGRHDHPDSVFNLQEGQFTRSRELFGEQLITGAASEAFGRLLAAVPERHAEIFLPSALRKSLLEDILIYYRLHLPITGEFKSHHVLHEVLQK
jgi:DNA repair protein RecO (recombination protein O)